jgi:GT2 family glycosyltransferase/glycosyltransferase involved in cell wall biosynthesis
LGAGARNTTPDLDAALVAPPDPFHRNVSVIVLNYNQAQTTLECLDALSRAHNDLIREIIVIDNGSNESELDILREKHRRTNFNLIEVGENRFFSEGNNIGVDFAQGDYIVFLNNDAFVEPGWIEALADTMRSDPGVAAVGPMFLYPDGRVQEVGGVVLPTGDVVQVGKGSLWGPDHFDTPCLVDFCSAACLMMRRRDFLEVGGLGFEWEPAYYEDVDLCLKLWTQCGKVMVNPAARVIHIESKTTSDRQLQLQDISEINRVRFVAKWGAWLETRQTRHLDSLGTAPEGNRERLNTSDLALLADGRATFAPQFVLYSPYPVVPGGGERVMFELASHLSSMVGRSNVAFCTPHRYSALRMRQVAATFGLHDVVGAPVPWHQLEPDTCRLAVVLGNSIIPPVPAFGERCVYQLQFPFFMSDRAVAEGATLLADYDEIWVYSEFVRRHVNGLVRHYGLKAPRVRIVSPPATWSGATKGLPWLDRKTILSVGRFFAGGHNKRQDVVIEAFRRIVESGTTEGLELALAGSIHPGPAGRSRFLELRTMAAGLNCRFYPNIGRVDLAALYARSAVLIHAAGFGVDPDEFPETLEHFGITPVEAASFGCIPVVYGQGGPREVIGVLGCNTAFSTVDECARIVSGLLEDPDGSTALSARVRQNSECYSAEAFGARVDEALRDLKVII